MKRIFTAIFVATMLLFPAASFADSSSSCLAYNAPSVCNASASRTVSSTSANSSLPFTGLDVALLVAGGVTLLGAGLIVRKLSSSTE
jgi:hypothetical protein